jgi:hypothetical protein
LENRDRVEKNPVKVHPDSAEILKVNAKIENVI